MSAVPPPFRAGGRLGGAALGGFRWLGENGAGGAEAHLRSRYEIPTVNKFCVKRNKTEITLNVKLQNLCVATKKLNSIQGPTRIHSYIEPDMIITVLALRSNEKSSNATEGRPVQSSVDAISPAGN
ncbi:hypothetical protein EVAR_84814_1 [Eumeta japonica]|uniref:Uncharacterized protein n=1 Tax=Eumeta variegata TaxID=151549 RepID=A0A4C1U9G9_EUMVA|nr:hypothetical protein EVAR_84814_1 [Eumeta japonica]